MAALDVFDFGIFVLKINFDKPDNDRLGGIDDLGVLHARTDIMVGDNLGRTPVVCQVDGFHCRGHES